MSGNYIGNNPNGTDYILSDDYRTNNTKLFASTACVNNAVNEIKGTAFLPLGHFFLHPFPTPPDGCLVVNGSEYNRELYKDLFADAVRKNYVKPESEWQQIASANGGYCPWYSDGDGSTTFRTPKFAPYQKLALASGDAGKYYEAGLPNIEGYVNNNLGVGIYGTREEGYLSGAFHTGTTTSWFPMRSNNTDGTQYMGFYFSAASYNPIYGSSNTVQPESHDWIVCVVAFGAATNVGSVDVVNVMSAVGQVQANPNLQGLAHLVDTWKSEDGSSWYRKWSDGWIEQGGNVVQSGSWTHIVFCTPFNSIPVYAQYQLANLVGNYPDYFNLTTIMDNFTTVGMNIFTKDGENRAATNQGFWYACGY